MKSVGSVLFFMLLFLILGQNSVVGQDNSSINITNDDDLKSIQLSPEKAISDAISYVSNFLVKQASSIGFLMIGVYLVFFGIVGLIYRTPYLLSNPSQDLLTRQPRPREDYQEEYDQWERQGNFSTILTGFSITALVFVFTLFKDKLGDALILIEFFSLAFIFEMISVLLYRQITIRAFKYYGNVFQVLGLLAFLTGFFVFIISQLGVSPVLTLIYLLGYFAFYLFSSRELGISIDQMKAWKKRLKSKCSICGKIWEDHTDAERVLHAREENYGC